MNHGLLDLPAPLLNALDSLLARPHLPALLRIVVYACLLAWASMRVYRRFSDQQRLGELREMVAQSQRAMARHEGNFTDLSRLVRENMRLSFRQLGLTLLPAIVASLPLLFILPWLSNRFDVQSPRPGTLVQVCVKPATAAASLHWRGTTATSVPDSAPGCWRIPWPDSNHRAALIDTKGQTIYMPDPDHPSRIVQKFVALNWLIGNPAGYLPASATPDILRLALPARNLTGIGPPWTRGWELWFFGPLILTSLLLKLRWRLH